MNPKTLLSNPQVPPSPLPSSILIPGFAYPLSLLGSDRRFSRAGTTRITVWRTLRKKREKQSVCSPTYVFCSRDGKREREKKRDPPALPNRAVKSWQIAHRIKKTGTTTTATEDDLFGGDSPPLANADRGVVEASW